jgi:hypothetical protein
LIHYVATSAHLYTIGAYLGDWRPSVSRHIQPSSYEDVIAQQVLPVGTYIFSDVERLIHRQAARAGHIAERLSLAGARLLNHPERTLGRYDLLRMLHKTGDNDFQIHRVHAIGEPVRFPVFLRLDRDHRILSPLLNSERELHDAVRSSTGEGHAVEDLLAVEFCDTSDFRGVYRKYGAFIVGDRVLARHLLVGRHWTCRVQGRDVDRNGTIREEWEYVTSNPHAEWLRGVFERAGVRYGRIDYSFLDGRPQVWEINTNPQILNVPQDYVSGHFPTQVYFARQFESALRAVELDIPQKDAFSVAIGPG